MFLVPACVLKTFELALTVTCLVLHQLCYDLTQLTTLMLCSGTFFGFIIVLTGEIVGEVVGQIEIIQDMVLSTIGMVMFSYCGVVQLLFHDHICICVFMMVVFCFATAIFMLADLLLACFETGEDYDESESTMFCGAAGTAVQAWWSAAGTLAFFASACLLIYDWMDVPYTFRRKLGLYLATLCYITAAVLLWDTLRSAYRAGKPAGKEAKKEKDGK